MQKQTTVTIDQKTFATLDRLAKSNDVSKKEFLSCALEYFEKYGINPVQHESPAKEMQKLIKRCDQVIAFIRKQEQDILRPACAAISTTEARIERVLDKLATAGQVRDLQKAVSDQQQRQNYDARNLRSSLFLDSLEKLPHRFRSFIRLFHDLCGLFQPPGNLLQWGEVKRFAPEIEPGSLEVING